MVLSNKLPVLQVVTTHPPIVVVAPFTGLTKLVISPFTNFTSLHGTDQLPLTQEQPYSLLSLGVNILPDLLVQQLVHALNSKSILSSLHGDKISPSSQEQSLLAGRYIPFVLL